MPAPVPHVELEGVTKRYGATVAVNDATLAFAHGGIHALVGENGAGKSTLGKIIAGVVAAGCRRAPGGGRGPCGSARPATPSEHGITTIAQELSLVPARSVVENVFLGIEDHRFGVVRQGGAGPAIRGADRAHRHRGARRRARPPAVRRGPAEGGDPACARAGARLIIMDEPTARLSSTETASLHRTMRDMAAAGTTIIFISHFLDEVLEVADMVDGHA